MNEDLLIVDDQPGIQLLLRDVLTNDGFEVTTASDGKEAIDLLSKRHFALVMLDYKLPIIDGVGILQEMQDREIHIPAIVMSGLVEKIENELQAFPNVVKVIAKPFDIMEVPQIVRQSIDPR